MPLPPAHQPLAESDFEAIEAAVKETARGRWFLDEYAYRNRNADTKLVLDAIQRLQRSVLGAEMLPAPAPTPQVMPVPEISAELSEIERMAEETRTALSQIDAARKRDGDLGHELDEIVAAQAQAISEVLSDADRIGEISATMRAQGIAESVCDQLDGLSTHINTACAFQDLTGQRTHTVVLALRVLEARVASLVKLWHAEGAEPAPAKNELESGPARAGEGMVQDQIDELLSIDQNHDVFWEENAKRPAELSVQEIKVAPATVIEIESAADAIGHADIETAPLSATPFETSARRSDLDRLSPDERRALFC
jgi:chemotaxis protein CheZ